MNYFSILLYPRTFFNFLYDPFLISNIICFLHDYCLDLLLPRSHSIFSSILVNIHALFLMKCSIFITFFFLLHDFRSYWHFLFYLLKHFFICHSFCPRHYVSFYNFPQFSSVHFIYKCFFYLYLHVFHLWIVVCFFLIFLKETLLGLFYSIINACGTYFVPCELASKVRKTI